MKLPENVSESVRRRNPELYGRKNYPRGEASSAKSEQIVRHGPVVKAEGKENNATRFSVRVTSYRSRLLDPDNLCPKYFIDCLVYAGILRDDSPQSVRITVEQFKCAKSEERTELAVECL